ncbi:MAG TPA: hypothetical protein VF816_14880 [Rhodocyclaceae bacterium]
MTCTVTVSFGRNSEYQYHFHDDEVGTLSRDEAKAWLHAEYESLECQPRNPVGKILLLDVMLDVAKYGGESHFAAPDDWAKRFALCCAAAMTRDVRIDVANLVVG